MGDIFAAIYNIHRRQRLGTVGAPAALTAQSRRVCGQRVPGVVRLTDVPAHGTGRRCIFERGPSRMDELRADRRAGR